MRKELILVLLAIIFTSFLSSFMSAYMPQIVPDKALLDTVVGVVGAGNFSYWQLAHTGNLIVELTSFTGDADIYVSESIRPGYEVEKNNFSSATCGKDVVNIPEDFPRPLGIAVFGYWSHEESEYSIRVYLEQSAEDALKLESHIGDEVESGTQGLSENSYHSKSYESRLFHKNDGDKKRRDKTDSQSFDEQSKPRLLKLLSILDMIFEMFLM